MFWERVRDRWIPGVIWEGNDRDELAAMLALVRDESIHPEQIKRRNNENCH